MKRCLIFMVLLAGEVRYVPLKVMPYKVEVDLGGMRFTAGMGLKF